MMYLLLVALLVASGSSAGFGSTALNSLSYSDGVTQQQAKTLAGDLLVPLKFQDDPAMTELLGVNGLGEPDLKDWLAQRVSYVIGEDDKVENNIVDLQTKYPYQNPDTFPDGVKREPKPDGGTPDGDGKDKSNGGDDPSPEANATVAMSNFGAGVYMMAKLSGDLAGYKFTTNTGQKSVIAITSPRVGILQIGDGLFQQLADRRNPAASANSYVRLSILYHEARHSDGHGKSLAFAHAFCPESHGLAYLPACDNNVNGPYAVGAQFNKAALKQCLKDKSCTGGQEIALSIQAADSMSRVISQASWDPAPEGK